MEVAQSFDGLGGNQRSVAREHDDDIVRRQGRTRDHQGVSRASLLALQHETDAGGGDRGADAVGFVSDDGVDVAGRNNPGGGRDYVRQQRLAANFMQHFGMLGFQPGSFTRSQNCNGDAGGAVILCLRHLIQYTARSWRRAGVDYRRNGKRVGRPLLSGAVDFD